jgi:hypothetical protein
MSTALQPTGKRLLISSLLFSPAPILFGIAMAVLSAARSSELPQGEISTSEYDVKAVFLYHFIQYLKWPEGIEPKVFSIVVLGKSEILAPLQEIAKKKNIGPTPIAVQQCLEIGQIGHPHVLFIAKSVAPKIAQALEKTRGTDILTISEVEGLGTRGVAINFVERDGKIKFEMSEKRLKESHIQIGSQLLKLAIRADKKNER